MSKIRTLIVDDEPLARRRLGRLLRAAAEVEVVGECGDGASAVNLVERQAPDLLLLDINMPGVDGFEVLESLSPARRPVVVFVTAHDAHALRAFEVHALDYLLKPIDGQRLARAVERAAGQVRLRRLGAPGQAQGVSAMLDEYGGRARPEPLRYLLARESGRIIPVCVDDVEWVEARGKYVMLHVAAATHLVREGMDRLEAKLDPARFLRIHRSTLVNVRCIKELEPAFHGDSVVLLRDGTRLTLSRSHRAAFRRVFGEGC